MSSKSKVLVTGATGSTGSLLIPKLLEAGINVRLFVRDESKARQFKELGAEIAAGDLDEPETIPAALEGIDKVYFLTWNGPSQLKQVENFIKVVKETGKNPHIIRHSMWGPENSRIIKQGLQAEELIKSSGLLWTMLKPTFFMQNTMMAVQTISTGDTIYWDMNDGKLAMIDLRDVADAAFAVITGEGHEGKSYILTGPSGITFHDVARAFSKVLEREIKYVSVPGEASKQAMMGMGLPEWIANGYVELSEGFSKNFAEQATRNVEVLTGHPAHSIEDFVSDHIQVFAGPQVVNN